MKNNSKLVIGIGLGMIVGSVLGFITGNMALIGVGMLFGVAIGKSLSDKTNRNKSQSQPGAAL
jgi:predicted MFS family arabinose efflux permease